ncbi:SDR family NAD(P)-dependent oxidoreductase [Faecalibacter macacae]|uniref:SDR family oxidoreductase n=1 Tax=Faecalibacter macacae TaxID=1859289 RepID=A0A3L9MAY6_9FLAO|nr:SDR family oxidoreductase [Faecalibacter macacae]RLZ09922.1 SDR family oxidoreductase [Faecalibacter macacae]
MAKVAANELEDRKIRVNVVSPGPTLTQGLQNAVPNEALTYLAEKTALQRLATPDEIGKVVEFLASDQSSFIKGTEIVVDGGLLNYTMR